MRITTLLAIASLSAAALTTAASSQERVDRQGFAAQAQRGQPGSRMNGANGRMDRAGSPQMHAMPTSGHSSYVSRGNGHHYGYGKNSHNGRNRCVHYYHGHRVYRCR